jgi:hypothetical protein
LRISTEEGNKGMFNFGNGKTLIDFIPDDLSHAATSFVESLKINSITEKSRRDRRVLVKRRKPLREMRSGFNQFLLPRPGIPIRYARNVRECGDGKCAVSKCSMAIAFVQKSSTVGR